jgi:hypothetical protein
MMMPMVALAGGRFVLGAAAIYRTDGKPVAPAA